MIDSAGRPDMKISSGRVLLSCLILAGAPLAMTPEAAAQHVGDNSWIVAGAYFPDIDTEVSIARPGEEEFATLVDFESDLALSDRDVLPSLSAGTRLDRKWRIEGEFFTLKRKGEKTLERDITFDGVTYPVSASAQSEFSSDIYRLTVGYSFIRRPNFELGASLGVHATNFTVSIRGEGQVGNAAASTEVRRREVLAPLPTVGVYAMYQILPNVGLGARADYFTLKIGDYDGKLLNVRAEASYALSDNFRIGAMYRHVKYRVDIEKRAYTGRISYEFNGPAVFLELAL